MTCWQIKVGVRITQRAKITSNVSGVCGHGQEASNGDEKWGNWKLFSLQRIWVEFRNNIALDNLKVSSIERDLQRAWIPVWNASPVWCEVMRRPVRAQPGSDVSRFTTLTRSGPGCVNMHAYIIQEAEQINQCIMGLRSEKLKNFEAICSYNQEFTLSCVSVRTWSVDALQVESLQSKNALFTS